MCTIRRAKIIIASLTVAAFIVQALSLFTTGVIDTTSSATAIRRSNTTSTVQKHFRSSKRDQLSEYYYQMKRAIVMIETVLTVVVPSFLIVLMNGLIVHSLQSERPSVSRVQFGRTFQTGANKHRSPSPSDNNREVHPIQVYYHAPFYCINQSDDYLNFQFLTDRNDSESFPFYFISGRFICYWKRL